MRRSNIVIHQSDAILGVIKKAVKRAKGTGRPAQPSSSHRAFPFLEPCTGPGALRPRDCHRHRRANARASLGRWLFRGERASSYLWHASFQGLLPFTSPYEIAIANEEENGGGARRVGNGSGTVRASFTLKDTGTITTRWRETEDPINRKWDENGGKRKGVSNLPA